MKARTSTKRRRGRPPLPDVPRTASGRIARNKAATAIYDIMNKRIATEARIRVYGAAEADCERQEWGYLLGRLYLNASYGLKSHQHEAGVRMAQDYARYFGLCGLPQPNARALDLFRVHGMAGDVEPDAAQKAKAKVAAIERLLGKSRNVLNVTKRICVYEQDDGIWSSHNLALLRAGLELASEYYGIPRE